MFDTRALKTSVRGSAIASNPEIYAADGRNAIMRRITRAATSVERRQHYWQRHLASTGRDLTQSIVDRQLPARDRL